MHKTKIAIAGYGNLGCGVELAVNAASDMELVGIFSRRDPSSIKTQTGAATYSTNDLESHADKIDVLVICGGSATDLPKMTPNYVRTFSVVDSFDTHAKIPEHFSECDAAARQAGNVAVISVGWDPGLFSIARTFANSVLPCGNDYTFWGKGVSQGHSDAIRRIDGVIDARQYTVPYEKALESVRAGENPELATSDKHWRECFVVVEDGADKKAIEREIKEMPNYFADYNTEVHFVTHNQLKQNHVGLPHGGSVIRTGSTHDGANKHVVEFKLDLDSNPEFTGSVLCAYARAAHALKIEGKSGCFTAFDIAPKYLSPLSSDQLRACML